MRMNREDGSLERVKELIGSGDSGSPLELKLIREATSRHKTTKENDKLLSLAFNNGSRELMKILLERGALSFCREEDRKLLHLAALNGYQEFFEIPLKLGADIDSIDRNGLTTLHFACGAESEALVSNLLEYGCDVDKISNNKFSRRAIDFADGDIADIIRKHIVKLWTLGFPVYMSDSKKKNSSDEITDFAKECEAEIKALKCEKISGTTVSLPDILTDNKDKLMAYTKNEKVVLFVKSEKCKEKFPIFASVLKAFIWRGIVRRVLLERSVKVFHDCCEGLPKLPDTCVERILRHLDDKELRRFIRIYLHAKREETLFMIFANCEKDLKRIE